MINLTGLAGRDVFIPKEFPKENDTHEVGEVVGGFINKDGELTLLVACDDKVRQVEKSICNNFDMRIIVE